MCLEVHADSALESWDHIDLVLTKTTGDFSYARFLLSLLPVRGY